MTSKVKVFFIKLTLKVLPQSCNLKIQMNPFGTFFRRRRSAAAYRRLDREETFVSYLPPSEAPAAAAAALSPAPPNVHSAPTEELPLRPLLRNVGVANLVDLGDEEVLAGTSVTTREELLAVPLPPLRRGAPVARLIDFGDDEFAVASCSGLAPVPPPRHNRNRRRQQQQQQLAPVNCDSIAVVPESSSEDEAPPPYDWGTYPEIGVPEERRRSHRPKFVKKMCNWFCSK